MTAPEKRATKMMLDKLPDCFCTHDRRRTLSLCHFLESRYSRDKLPCLHVVSVTAKRMVSPGSVARILARLSPPAKLWEMLVPYSLFLERFGQHFFVEMRIAL